jgi:intein/homing endonuclease
MTSFQSPQSLYDAYSNGFIGSIADPDGTKELLKSLPMPFFGDAAKQLSGSGAGKLSLPFKLVQKFDPKFGESEKQEQGDCYHKDTIVVSNHCNTIENVDIGDDIFGPDGSLTKVISKQKKISYNPLITIKTHGSLPLKVTSDHRVLVGRKELQNNQSSNVLTKNKIITKQWVRAESIAKGDYLITPINISKTEKPINEFSQHEDFEWFLGYFLGDGWCDKGNIEITFAKHQYDFFIRCFKYLSSFGFNVRRCDYKSKETTSFRLRCCCAKFSKWLRLICYDENKNKIFPSWAIGNKNIVKGLTDSDGFYKENKEVFDSKSASLAYGVYYSYLNMGYKPTINYFHRSKKGSYGNGVAYRVTCIYNKRKNYSFIEDGFLYIRVGKIEVQEGPHEVYDIGVSHKDSSFLANGIIAHNCVSHSGRNAVDVSRAADILMNGSNFNFVTRGAVEGMYGHRGHTGEGMTCNRSIQYLTTVGGVLIRKKYGNIDLTNYNARLSGGWGRTGTPKELNEEAKKNQVKTASLLTSIEQARDALFNGYGITLCSMAGFSNKRDQHGISQRQGQWAHAMAWIACDDTREIYNEMLFLIQNSWGIWNGGPKRHGQPEGSFWIRESVARDMIRSGEGFAVSNIIGFPPRKIDWTLDTVF